MKPRLLSLSEAVHEIIEATRPRSWQTHDRVPWDRYFFIVGAGISYPSIPLASGIEDLCRKEILERGDTLSAAGGSAMERYETIFQAAFSHPEDRRAFLHHHIKSAPISAANFRLAHLVSADRLSNLVVTTNFDELLTKALRLFGKDVIVCDHPRTTQRIDPKRRDFQVVHVHGTHWFYDCCNLKEEIEHRAEDDREDNTTMSYLLDRILFDRSPLVVGYSGWEGDVVMAALKRRLKLPLSYNLYWFCFRRADFETLPRWLREHENVRFVTPPVPPAETGSGASAISDAAEITARAEPALSGATGDSRPNEPTLAPRQVFDALIEELRLDEPELTKTPLDFFAEQLRINLVVPDVSDEDDIYLIRSVIRQVNEGAKLTRQEMETRSQKAKEATVFLDQVNRAVRGAAYGEAVTAARALEFTDLSEAQRTDLDNALEAIYRSSFDSESKIGLEVCDMRSRLCEVAQRLGDRGHDWSLSQAKAVHGKGYCLAKLLRRAEAIAAYDEVLQRFGEATEPTLKAEVARALVNKGIVLSEDGKRGEAIATYDEVGRRFGAAAEPGLKEQAARALVNKGIVLNRDGKRGEAIATYDEVERRFGAATEPGLKEQAARALANKGYALSEDGKKGEAIGAYDEVVRRFGDATEPVVKAHVARALVNKGVVLNKDGKRGEAIAAYDEVVRRVGEATEPALKVEMARALVQKGIVLYEDGKRGEAIAGCDEVLRRLGEATEPALREMVVFALVHKGFVLNEDGKRGEAIATYDEVVRRFGEATEPVVKAHVVWALAKKGYALNEDGKRGEAIAAYDEVVRRFGDATEPAVKEQVDKARTGRALIQGKK